MTSMTSISMHEDYYNPMGLGSFSSDPLPLAPTSSPSSSLHRTLLILGICVSSLTVSMLLLVFIASFCPKHKNSFENKHHENHHDLEHGQEQEQEQDEDGHIVFYYDSDDDTTNSYSSDDNNVAVKSPTWLKQLNIVKYQGGGGGMGGSSAAAASSSVCNICFDNYKIGDPCRVMPGCGHVFHHSCVDIWFKKSPTCPTCRNSITDALALALAPPIK